MLLYIHFLGYLIYAKRTVNVLLVSHTDPRFYTTLDQKPRRMTRSEDTDEIFAFLDAGKTLSCLECCSIHEKSGYQTTFKYLGEHALNSNEEHCQRTI